MATATNSTLGEIVLGGDLTGTADSPQLVSSGVIPGTYTPVGRIVADAKGRVLAIGAMSDQELITETAAATTSQRGIVQIGENIAVSSAVISLPNASSSVLGVFTLASPMVLTAGDASFNYSAIADATTSVKGLVEIGAGLVVSSGVVSVPDATTSVKGIVQIGSGLSVAAGVVSVAVASNSVKGIVQVGAGLTVTSGVISFISPEATTSAKGLVQIGTGLGISAGVAFIPNATNVDLGIVVPVNSANLSFSAGGALDVGSNVAVLDQAGTYSAAQVTAKNADSFAATYAPDLSLSNCFSMTLTGNITLANPTNAIAGGVYTILFTQDATGSRTLTISGSSYKFTSVVLSTNPNTTDVITLICKSSTEIYVLLTPGF